MSDSCVTPRTVAQQAALSMGFPRQKYWSGLLFPSSGDLLDPGIKPVSPVLQEDSLPTEPAGKPLQGFSTHELQKNSLELREFPLFFTHTCE